MRISLTQACAPCHSVMSSCSYLGKLFGLCLPKRGSSVADRMGIKVKGIYSGESKNHVVDLVDGLTQLLLGLSWCAIASLHHGPPVTTQSSLHVDILFLRLFRACDTQDGGATSDISSSPCNACPTAYFPCRFSNAAWEVCAWP